MITVRGSASKSSTSLAARREALTRWPARNRFPERVKRVALVRCIAPYSVPTSDPTDDELTRLACTDPDQAAEQVARSATWLIQTPERFLDLPRPEPDRHLLTEPAVRSMF